MHCFARPTEEAEQGAWQRGLVMIFTTHGSDGESSDAVFGKVLSLFQRNLYIPICGGAIGRPVLLTFPLQMTGAEDGDNNAKLNLKLIVDIHTHS